MTEQGMTPAQRTLRAKVAAYTSWANTTDRAARTAAARKAAHDRFEDQVDPNGVLPPAVRAQKAESARRAHFSRLAMLSAQSRARRVQGRRAKRTPAKVKSEPDANPTGHAGERV